MLLLDTCGASGSVALARLGPARVFAQDSVPGRNASELLVPAIRSLIESAGIVKEDLDVIAVVHGPGSFTGVRIGVSTAKALCESLNIPIVAISRLAVLAARASAGRILPLLDAGRAEFYCGDYRDGICVSERLLTREALCKLAAEAQPAVLIACESAILAALTPSLPVLAAPEPVAADALSVAVRRIAERSFDDAATVDANYVRRSDRELFASRLPPVSPSA